MIISNDELALAICAFLLSLIFAFSISILFKLYNGADPSLKVKRAAHAVATSRLGGLAALSSLAISIIIMDVPVGFDIFFMLIPIFCIGILEDLTIEIKTWVRLVIGSISGVLFIYFRNSWISIADVPGLDYLLSFAPIGIFFTVFCLLGLLNAINLIDGVNGLASGKIIISSSAIFWLSSNFSEPEVRILSLLVFSSMAGVFVLNYPSGKVFLGDTGAYCYGFLLGMLLVILKVKHPEISGWAIFLIIFWPAIDIVHVIYRRKAMNSSSDRADMMHMHHVIMRSIEILFRGRITRRVSNPVASTIILPLAGIPVFVAVIYPTNSSILVFVAIISSAIFFLLYVMIFKIIRSSRLRRIFLSSIKN